MFHNDLFVEKKSVIMWDLKKLTYIFDAFGYPKSQLRYGILTVRYVYM